MIRTVKPAALLMLLLCSAIARDQPYTPRSGAKGKVVFKIDHLGVQGDWAFLRGVPRQRGGGAMSYRGTVYQEAIDAGAFDDGIVALLRKRRGKWQVVKYVIGATDVPYVEWDKEYRAPSAIFQE
jgi:hypothetical protein